MDLSTKKHNVVALFENKLQLWDTHTNRALVTYQDVKYDASNTIDLKNIRCNCSLIIIKFGFDLLNIYDIYKGNTIKKMNRISQFDVCNTHLVTSSYDKNKIVITDLKTMSERSFNIAAKLFRLCINSKYLAGIDIGNNKLVVYDHANMHANMDPTKPVYEISTFHTHVIMNEKHIFTVDKSSGKNSVSIISLETGKTESEFTIGGNNCKIWLNPINNSVYVTALLLNSSITIIKIDPNTLQQTQINHDSYNLAIGTAIASFYTKRSAESFGYWDIDYTHNIKIQSDNTNIMNKIWSTQFSHFSMKAVVLDEIEYVKDMLVTYIISDVANIVIKYIKN